MHFEAAQGGICVNFWQVHSLHLSLWESLSPPDKLFPTPERPIFLNDQKEKGTDIT